MKLTNILFRWKKLPPKGNIYKGKYRLVKPVTGLHVAIKRAEFELEEKNMFYLRNPYLTVEQAKGQAITSANYQNEAQKSMEEKIKRFQKDKLLGDRFGFLKVSDKWEKD